jgi:hypothetical protein
MAKVKLPYLVGVYYYANLYRMEPSDESLGRLLDWVAAHNDFPTAPLSRIANG